MRTKLSREERKKRMVRIMAMILAFLMVAGAATYTIMMLASAVSADETSGYTTIDTSSLEDSGDVPVSVGLMYGSNITVSFQTWVANGYTLGLQNMYGGKEFTPIWDLWTNSVSVAADTNLYKDGSSYYPAYGAGNTYIGAYHLEVHCDIYDRNGFTQLYESKKEEVTWYGYYAIPAYIYTGYALRVGNFETYEQAQAHLETVRQIFPGHTVTVAYPTGTAVSVINPYTDRIEFEFDCGGRVELGLRAKEDWNGNTHLKTPAGNVYDGVFAFKRYNNGSVDGVSLINIISLEAYIGGVLPFETSNTWPIETQKAFAIAVRSFTLTQLNKHSSHTFDLCNTVHCQVYKGAGRINQSVMQALRDTKGKVVSYDGQIVTAYYSSSTGGVTVDAEDAWGSKIKTPYLRAKATPWEDYVNHSNAFWTTEISPTTLLERLRQAGYTSLYGAVADVFIKEFANNSTYIKALGVTDIYGNTVTITNTDSVRTALTPYVKSSNFVIGKGSVAYTVAAPTLPEPVPAETLPPETVPPETTPPETDEKPNRTYDKDFGYTDILQFTVMTAEGSCGGQREESEVDGVKKTNISVLTGDGEINYPKRDVFVMSVENAAAFLGEETVPVSKTDGESELPETAAPETAAPVPETAVTANEQENNGEISYKVAYAENENNFIIVGKGWGHGVGMSQWGAYDLAVLGKTAEEILHAYFTDIEIVHYTETKNFR